MTNKYDLYEQTNMHPCDFAEFERHVYIVNTETGEKNDYDLPAGIATIDELIQFRKYERENQHKPNDWDSLQPNGIFLNGAIIDDVETFDRIIKDPYILNVALNYDPTNKAHLQAGWFKELANMGGV